MRKFAGEKLVLDELQKQGFSAELLPRQGNRAPEIKIKDKIFQIRTRKNSVPGWLLNNKAENLFSDNYFYVFVNLNENKKPIFRVVPSADVAVYTRINHAHWLKGESKVVARRKDTPLRKFNDYNGVYVNAWDLLE